MPDGVGDGDGDPLGVGEGDGEGVGGGEAGAVDGVPDGADGEGLADRCGLGVGDGEARTGTAPGDAGVPVVCGVGLGAPGDPGAPGAEAAAESGGVGRRPGGAGTRVGTPGCSTGTSGGCGGIGFGVRPLIHAPHRPQTAMAVATDSARRSRGLCAVDRRAARSSRPPRRTDR